jgi:O-antigen ligase
MNELKDSAKSPTLKTVEAVILMICLSVLALRSLYTESLHIFISKPNAPLGTDAFSLIITATLIFSAAAWILTAICAKKITYQKTGIEIPLILFLIAGTIAACFASNKKAAINDLYTIVAAILTAILLIQILNTSTKIKIVLMTLIALGAVNTYQCAEQFTSNKTMIEAYQQNPNEQLAAMGIEPGTFQQSLFEHRLYSEDIRGFFTTSNSAGSFMILTIFAAIALLAEKIKNRKAPNASVPILICSLALIANVIGLTLTQSKGAISAAILGIAMLIIYLTCGAFLARHRFKILIALAAAAVLLTIAAIFHGLEHESLPGGNSMLVRWQYWHAAGQMYADNPITGVGGGNFASHYTHYKIPASLETVVDPHNFVLSLLTQYGPLGLIGFCSAFLAVLYRVAFGKKSELNLTERYSASNENSFSLYAGLSLFFLLFTLLLIRPIFTSDELGNDPAVMASVIVIMYVMPAGVFALAFAFLWAAEKSATTAKQTAGNLTAAIIFCGVCAVAIANLIDFAIFEPAVLTSFWVSVAILFCANKLAKQKSPLALELTPKKKLIATVITIAGVGSFCHLALVPTLASSSRVQQAMQSYSSPYELLENAAKADPLNPDLLKTCGNIYLSQFEKSGMKEESDLNKAAEFFVRAAALDNADFKIYKKLTETHKLLAEAKTEPKGKDIEKAYHYAIEALKRYPGSAELHIEMALMAERLDKFEEAIAHYETAIQIENDYREMFRLMYPGRKMVDRLETDKYMFAKERIEQLSTKE